LAIPRPKPRPKPRADPLLHPTLIPYNLEPMAEPTFIPPESFEIEHQAFQKALEGSSSISTELPFLKWTDSYFQNLVETLIEKYREPVKKLVESFRLWLEKIFGGQENSPIELNWTGLAEGFGILVIVILIILMALKLLKYFNEKDFSGLSLKRGAGKIETNEEFLLGQIKGFLKQKNWAKASRIRWTLFLERKGLNPELTPYEYESSQKNLNWQKSMDQYQRMFDLPQADKEWFFSYHKSLLGLEEAP